MNNSERENYPLTDAQIKAVYQRMVKEKNGHTPTLIEWDVALRQVCGESMYREHLIALKQEIELESIAARTCLNQDFLEVLGNYILQFVNQEVKSRTELLHEFLLKGHWEMMAFELNSQYSNQIMDGLHADIRELQMTIGQLEHELELSRKQIQQLQIDLGHESVSPNPSDLG